MWRIKKILNLFIWMFNVMNYLGHLHTHCGSDEYEFYNFDEDVKYF